MADPVYYVGIEFESGSFTTITDDVLKANINRNLGDALSGFRPGGAQFILINQDGKYSPDNVSSDFAGLMRPQLPIKMTATYAGSSFNLFTGTIDDWRLNPNLGSPRNTTISARDNGKRLKNINITTSLFANYNVGSLYHEVLTAGSVNSFQIDTMDDDSPFTWFKDVPAQDAINELSRAGFSYTFVDGAGVFNVKRRYYELSGSIQSSLDEFYDMNYGFSDDNIFNLVTVEGEPREADTATQTLAFIPNAYFIQASSHISFALEYLDPLNNEPAPGVDMISPVNSLDYKTNTFLDGSGTDRTDVCSVVTQFFGQTATTSLFNGSGDDVFLTTFNLRGTPIHRRPRFSVFSENSSSQALYDIKEMRLYSPYLKDQEYAQNYSNYLLARNLNPEREISVVLRNEFPLLLNADVAGQLHLANTFLGVNSRHVITGLSHQIDLNSGLVHQVNYNVETLNDQDVLILDDPDFGVLDSRRLGF